MVRRNIKDRVSTSRYVFLKSNQKVKKYLTAAQISGIAVLSSACSFPEPEDGIYTGKITDERDVELKDKNNNTITTFEGNDGVENDVLLFKKPSTNEVFEAVVENNGKLAHGYLAGSDIILSYDGKYEDIGNSYYVSLVSAPKGAYVFEDKTVDTDTDEAELLEAGTYILAGKLETSSENAYMWKKVLYFSDDEASFKDGYMISDYIYDIENPNEARKFVIQQTQKGLALRSQPDRSDEYNRITTIPAGEFVYVVPNNPGKVDDECDWIYVAYTDKKTGDVSLGWVAATQRFKNGEERNYLAKVNSEISEEEIVEDNEYVTYIVDTSSAKYNPLKLRENKGTDAKIIAKLENGTELYLSQSDIDDMKKSKKINGHYWVKVELKDGTTGYVASEYLKEKNAENEKSAETNIETKVVELHKEGKIEGALGIDVDPRNISIGEFEELVKGNKEVKVSGAVKGKVNFVYIKMGASSYGRGKMQILNPEERVKLAENFARVCDENEIPYGFYYYDQAITEKETEKEVDYIKKYLPKIQGKYGVLPLAIDTESNSHNGKAERLVAYVSEAPNNEKAKRLKEITNMKLNMVSTLKKAGIDSTFYTNNDGLNNILDYKSLSDEQKKKLWVVDLYNSPTHSKNLTAKKIVPGVENRQLTLGEVAGDKYDIDFMTSEALKEYLERANLKYKENSRENVISNEGR